MSGEPAKPPQHPAQPQVTGRSAAAVLDEHFASKLQDVGVVISVHAADAGPEALELAEYPFFLATAFQPQVGSSQSGELHPILSAWLRVAAAGRPVRPGR